MLVVREHYLEAALMRSLLEGAGGQDIQLSMAAMSTYDSHAAHAAVFQDTLREMGARCWPGCTKWRITMSP